eukprot:TRINITY_DN7583_c0_g1_i1.p1 TRINITY_DN7583_c0_g1~~TRINITY_DN7583_c0_g1_i1.p1  ORF type:complete len:421 (-),score=53.39 TRINITY_DN7583_c0_g1_i1:36-1262(-)
MGSAAVVAASFGIILLSSHKKQLSADEKRTHHKDVQTVVGLANLGNTCFANAVLQGLASAPTFVKLLRGLKADLPPIITSLRDSLNALQPGEKSGSVVPREFIGELAALKPSLGEGTQQDAHELLVLLLDRVNIHADPKDVADIKGASKGHNLTPLRALNLLRVPTQGTMEAVSSCLTCHRMRPSLTEPFETLSLPTPLFSTHIRDCLRGYALEETVGPVECIHCSLRQAITRTDLSGEQLAVVRREMGLAVPQMPKFVSPVLSMAKRALRIAKAPQVLVLHLHAARPGIVVPPILDIAPYSVIAAPPRLYRLCAAVSHLGTDAAGHFICFRKVNSSWVRISDTCVVPAGLADIARSAMFMAIYEAVSEEDRADALEAHEREVAGTNILIQEIAADKVRPKGMLDGLD